MMKTLTQKFESDPDITFHMGCDLSSFMTLKLIEKGNVAIVRSIESLKRLVAYCRENSIAYRALGRGANQVLAGEQLLYIQPSFIFDESKYELVQERYYFPASVSLAFLTKMATNFGLKGWEVLTGIPATVGGAIYMNAGTSLGEIGSLVESVEIMNHDGNVRRHLVKDGDFSYRKNHFVRDGEFIVGATLKHFGVDVKISEKIKEYLNYRKTTQPLRSANCGCVFKNFPDLSAGRLVDRIGLKGLMFDGMQVSTLHANFIENSGKGNAASFEKLVSSITTEVERYTGRKIECEVQYLYNMK
ncbi:MAG: FAD-binding protein [Bacteroidetes bacterium]|nr:FAD-binding protein [Bacteroidota bacterium]